MHLRRQTRSVFGFIIALQLATSFGAIALLTRMGPVIATVAEENVESLAAVERMVAALAAPLHQADAARHTFFEAYGRALNNITEAEESPLLDEIRADADGALAGDPGARERLLETLGQFANVNREALQRADREAQRLAEAGAWAAAILAVAAFLFVRITANRVDRHFVMPLLEIAGTLEAARQGDRFRRCSGRSGSPEIQTIADGVNQLLDDAKQT